jgi:cellulose synthase operon protein C
MPSLRSLALLLLLVAGAARAAEFPALPPPEGRDPVAERFAAAAAALDRDRKGPRGLAALAELDALSDDLPDLARLAGVYARAADDRDADPEVRALARFRLAGVELARGNLQRRDAALKRLGLVTRWQVIGPFDDEGRAGYDAVLPPEERLDLSARLPGKVREVAWRALPEEAAAGGFVNLGAVLRPARKAVAYALAVVEAPRDERVSLWLGASGAAKVWVNGALAIADPVYHPARLDQLGVTVALRKGPNRILVKLCQQDGRMGFHLRLADERGEGRAFPAADPAAPPQAAGPAPRPLEGAVAKLEKRAAALAGRGRPEAEARLDLARALAVRGAFEPEERRAAAEASRAAELAPRWLDAQLEAARLADEHARRRAEIEAALRIAPADPRALAALAADELEQGREQDAARLFVRAIAAAPGWAEPRLGLADALERAGLDARAALLSAETALAFRTVPSAVRGAARAARRLGRLGETAQRQRTLLALRFDDGEARNVLAQLLEERGDLAGAEALIREGLRIDPADGFLRLRLADLLAANGRPEDAEAAFAAALALAPDEAEAWERRGRARLAAGRPVDAQADLVRALELRPQDPALKELVRSLEPARERFEAPYVLDAQALAKAAPPPAADDDALVLGELKVSRVFPSGLSSTWTQVVVKVLNQRGADQLRRHVVGWAPERQEVRVERARILKPDGSVVEAREERQQSASEPWYRLYYDTVTRSVSFPALAPGDVLEVAWRVDDVANENLLSDYFGDFDLVDGASRKLRWDWVLLVPRGRELFSSAGAGIGHDVRPLPGDVVEHRFTARDTPRIQPEPDMPGIAEVARSVHVSTYASWDQVNRFYWGLIREQLRPGPELRAEAERLARAAVPARNGARVARAQAGAAPAPVPPPGGFDLEAKKAIVRAVYGFVVSQTRYVGLEIGIHGYKPYRVDQILQRRFGDCKDKASLMHALLEAVGIDSRIVLLRMRRLGRIPEAPASLAVFNHAILYVPELEWWLDGTASFSGSGDLPDEDRGATVLVVNPSGPPRFGAIPEARPDENRFDRRYAVALAADGGATLEAGWRITGVDAPTFRRAYLAEGERRSQLEQVFTATLPGAHVEDVKVSDPTRLEEPVAMDFTVSVPRFAQPDGDGLRFAPFARPRGFTEEWAPLSVRKLPLDLGGPAVSRHEVRVALPPGFRLAEAPPAARGESPFGSFEVSYREERGALVAEARVTRTVSRVSPAEYPAFRAWVADLDRAVGRRVRVARAEVAR